MKNIKFYKPISIQRTPCASDYVLKTTVRPNPYYWIHGIQIAAAGTNKFQYMSDSADPVYYLNLQLVAGTAHGVPLSFCAGISSIQVDYANLVFRDDGYGGYWANYCDFINNIFNQLNLFTRLSAAGDGSWRTYHCKTDDFFLTFKETPSPDFVADAGINGEQYWQLASWGGYFLGDTIGFVTTPYGDLWATV